MSDPTSPGARPFTQTLRWSFPSKPVARRQVFVIQRQLPDELQTNLPFLREEERDALAGRAALSERFQIRFLVEHEPSDGPGSDSTLHATLTFSAGEPLAAREPGDQEPESTRAGILLLAAQAWIDGYVISDERARWLLCLVFGEPEFDGSVATLLLRSEHAPRMLDAMARLALDDAAQHSEDSLALGPEAQTQLGAALLAELGALRALLTPRRPFAPGAMEEGMATWNARVAGYLDRLEEQHLAERVRQRGRKEAERPETLWAAWVPGADRPPLHRLSVVALALWRRKVRPRLERPAASVPRGVITTTQSLFHSKQPLPRLQTLGITVHRTPEGGEVEAVDTNHRDKLLQRLELTGPVTDSVILEVLTDKARATRSMTGQVLLRHLFEVGYRQKVIENKTDFRTYTVQGGLAMLCQLLGRPMNGDEIALLRQALDGYELIRVPLPGNGFDGLLKWSERKAAPGRKAEIQIVMMDPMLPGYVHTMPRWTPSHREGRVLVPIPVRLPPLTGHHAKYGAKLVLQMFVLEAIAMGWREYAEGVNLPPSTWDQLADRADLERKDAEEARHAFVAGTDEAPPFLVRRSDDRYQFATAYRDAERVILESAQIRTVAAEGHEEKKRARKKQTRK